MLLYPALLAASVYVYHTWLHLCYNQLLSKLKLETSTSYVAVSGTPGNLCLRKPYTVTFMLYPGLRMLLYLALLATLDAQFMVSHRAKCAICRCSLFTHLLGWIVSIQEGTFLDTQISWNTQFSWNALSWIHFLEWTLGNPLSIHFLGSSLSLPHPLQIIGLSATFLDTQFSWNTLSSLPQ